MSEHNGIKIIADSEHNTNYTKVDRRQQWGDKRSESLIKS